MADNNQQSHNDYSPFRRYVPPSGNGANNGKVAPLSQPSTTRKPSASTPKITPRRSRGNRSRWRKWVQSTPPKSTQRHAASSSNRRSPDQRSSMNEATPNARQPIQSPFGTNPVPPLQPLHNEPSRFVKAPAESLPQTPRSRSGGQPNGVRPAPTPPSVNNGRPQRPYYAQRSHPAPHKVTPLRDRAAGAGAPPTGMPPEKGYPRRDRKPRRQTRKAPRPVLYGIRLLILGTGIAAIAGTILSSLNPGQEATVSEAANTQSSAATQNRSNGKLSPALAQPLPLADELVAVETDLVSLETMTPGLNQSVFFYDLETGNYIDLNGTETVAAASTIKVPILVAFLRAVDAGTVRLDQAITLRDEMVASGSGEMQFDETGTQYTALEVATEMIVNSDNTATNLMIELLGGIESLNQQFREWGLESTVLRNLLPDLDGTNTTSSADLVRVMALVDQGELLSMRSRDRLFSIMQRTLNRTLIPDGLADTTALAYNKTGDIGTSLGDVALVDVVNGKRYILSVLVERPFNDGRASELIRRVSERVYEEMGQPVSPLGGGQPETPTSPEPSETGDSVVSPESTIPTVPVETEPETYISPDSEPLSGPGVPPG